MNVFGFNTLQAVLGLFTFMAGGLFFGFLLQLVRFILYGLMDIESPRSGKEVKLYD